MRAAGDHPSPWPDLARPRESDRLHDLLALALLIIACLVLLATWDHSGPRFDENNHLRYGDALWRYYGSFTERYERILTTPYSGGYDLIGKAFRLSLPNLTSYEAIHLFGALVSMLGLLGAWKLGRLLLGSRGGFWTLLLLCATPPYYAHAFNNPKDVPFAVGYTWALYFLFRGVARFPNVPRHIWVKLGVAIGLALSVRIGALLLLGYVVMAVVAYLGRTALARRDWRALLHQTVTLAIGTALTMTLAWAIMLASWPWALRAPLVRPFKALAIMANYGANNGLMRFEGELIRFAEAPRTYLPTYFAVQLPEMLLALALPGLALVGWLIARRARSLLHLRQSIVLAVLLVAILFPPVYAIYKQSTLYEGMRHFLFVVPALCVVSALIVVRVSDAIRARAPRLVAAWIALLVAGCAVPVHAMIRLHPHQFAYFNSFVGGLPGATGRYDTSGPGAYREAFEKLSDHLWRTEPERYFDTYYQVGGCFDATAARAALPPNFEVSHAGDLDFWVAYTMNECHTLYADRPELLRVERDGALIVVVRDLRGAGPRESTAPWRAAYYLNPNLEGTAITDRVWALNFDWGTSNPRKGVPEDDFSATFDTCVDIAAPMTVRFAVTANNGARLYVDGEPLIDAWRTPGTSRDVAEVGLDAGLHHLRVDYVEQRRNAGLWLRAGFAGGALVSLPSRVLSFPTDDPAQPCPSRSPAP